MTIEEAIEEGAQQWFLNGKNVTLDVGDSKLFFWEGRLSMIVDDNGKEIALAPGEVLLG